MSHWTRVALLGAASVIVPLVSGCAMEQQQVVQSLEQGGRVDCRTADGDIRVLQSEKAHVLQQIAEGATAIYPAGAVMGILTGTEQTKIQVATGEYNDMIDARIAKIRRTCGM